MPCLGIAPLGGATSAIIVLLKCLRHSLHLDYCHKDVCVIVGSVSLKSVVCQVNPLSLLSYLAVMGLPVYLLK